MRLTIASMTRVSSALSASSDSRPTRRSGDSSPTAVAMLRSIGSTRSASFFETVDDDPADHPHQRGGLGGDAAFGAAFDLRHELDDLVRIGGDAEQLGDRAFVELRRPARHAVADDRLPARRLAAASFAQDLGVVDFLQLDGAGAPAAAHSCAMPPSARTEAGDRPSSSRKLAPRLAVAAGCDRELADEMIVQERRQLAERLIRAARRAAVLQQAVGQHREAQRLRQRCVLTWCRQSGRASRRWPGARPDRAARPARPPCTRARNRSSASCLQGRAAGAGPCRPRPCRFSQYTRANARGRHHRQEAGRRGALARGDSRRSSPASTDGIVARLPGVGAADGDRPARDDRRRDRLADRRDGPLGRPRRSVGHPRREGRQAQHGRRRRQDVADSGAARRRLRRAACR